jgi:hypothetical protein
MNDIGRPDVGRLATVRVYDRAESDRLIAELEAARDRLLALIAAARDELRGVRERAGQALLDACRRLADEDAAHAATLAALHRSADHEAAARLAHAHQEAATVRALGDRLARSEDAEVLTMSGRTRRSMTAATNGGEV